MFHEQFPSSSSLTMYFIHRFVLDIQMNEFRGHKKNQTHRNKVLSFVKLQKIKSDIEGPDQNICIYIYIYIWFFWFKLFISCQWKTMHSMSLILYFIPVSEFYTPIIMIYYDSCIFLQENKELKGESSKVFKLISSLNIPTWSSWIE